MEPPESSFADEFNVSQEYAVLVFGVGRAAVSLSLQVHRLQVLVDAGLIVFPNACFEFADKGREEAQHDSLANLPKISASRLHGFSKVVVAGFCLASSLCCYTPFISASTPGPTHQPCGPRGRLERGASSAAGESMTPAMSVALFLVQVSSGIGSSVAIIAFATWHRRFRSTINCLRSAVSGASLVLSLFLRFGAGLRGMRTFAYTRL